MQAFKNQLQNLIPIQLSNPKSYPLSQPQETVFEIGVKRRVGDISI